MYYIRSVPLGAVYPDLRMPTSYRNKLIQEIIDWKPDIVHSQCEFFSFQFAARISRITGAPLVHTYHTLYEQYLTSYFIPSKRLGDLLAKVLSRQRLRHVKTLVAPTQKVEDALPAGAYQCGAQRDFPGAAPSAAAPRGADEAPPGSGHCRR